MSTRVYPHLVLDLLLGTYTREGETRFLSTSELAVLTTLASSPEPMSRTTLRQVALGYASSARSRALDATVVRLRKKLEVDPKNPEVLVTVRGRGLLLTSPPRSPDPLTGRDEERRRIRQSLLVDAVVVVTGVPGVGKSALLERCARDLDALHVDLLQARTRRELVGCLRAATHCEGSDLRRHLASLGHVIVLDGAECLDSEAQELLATLTARGRWLIAAWHPLALPGSEIVPLGNLAPIHARAVLADLVQERCSPRQVEALATFANHHPLTLRLVAGLVPTLGADGVLGLPVRDVMRLGADQGSLHEAFEASWTRLTPTEQRVMRQCSAFHGRFTVPEAASVSGIPTAAALEAMVQLVARGVLEPSDSGAFRMVDLVREFVRDRSPADRAPVRQFLLDLASRVWVEGTTAASRHLGLLVEGLPEIEDPTRYAAVTSQISSCNGGRSRVVDHLTAAGRTARFPTLDRVLLANLRIALGDQPAGAALLRSPPEGAAALVRTFWALGHLRAALGGFLPPDELARSTLVAEVGRLDTPLSCWVASHAVGTTAFPLETVPSIRAACQLAGLRHLEAVVALTQGTHLARIGEYSEARRVLLGVDDPAVALHATFWAVTVACRQGDARGILVLLSTCHRSGGWRHFPNTARMYSIVLASFAHVLLKDLRRARNLIALVDCDELPKRMAKLARILRIHLLSETGPLADRMRDRSDWHADPIQRWLVDTLPVLD